MIETLLNMDPWLITTFVGASVVLYLTPGADMMFVIASGVKGGPKAGVAATAGIILGVLCHVTLAAAGLAVLIASTPVALDVIRYAGAAYLAWLAWHSWRAESRTDEREGRADLWRAFRRGFADHDWAQLARSGEVAAVYMGKKSARFVQGRLLMHGADRDMAVTVVENASRADQRVLATTLDTLPADLAAAAFAGPALTFLGLAPRVAVAAAHDKIQMELA